MKPFWESPLEDAERNREQAAERLSLPLLIGLGVAMVIALVPTFRYRYDYDHVIGMALP